MKHSVFSTAVLCALSLQPLAALAHESTLAHVHEWPVIVGLVSSGIVACVVLRSFIRKLKR